ncbi:MAG: transporter substrate-binding domain-containing protein [Desulfobacterales bacterium]|nr:transporter substrate-binding domain-containing protein [Desulfobacterales bacterium]
MGIGKWKIGLLLFVVLWLSSAGASAADTGTRGVLPKFTVAEQQWLSSRARIWIGTMEAWPPMNFVNADGEPDGIGADYIREMNRLLDDRLEIVPAPFKINLEKVKHGELDAIMDITPTEDRKAYLDFTRIYLDIPHVMVGPREGPYYGSEADLSGKTIALEKGFYNIVYFQKNFPDVNIRIYPDTALALDAVARGEVDAYAGNRAVAAHIMEKELMATLKFHGRLNKMGSVLAIAVPKDRPELAGILDKTIAAIPKDRKQAIRRKWAGLTAAVDTSEDLPLTEEEKDWLAAHPKIRVHNEKDWPPFNYFEHGSPRGFSIDYMNLLADRLGIEIDYVTGPSWNDFLEMVQERDLDVMLNIVKTRDRQAYLLYTPPYVKNPNVIVSRENAPFDTVRSLIGRTVAIPKGFFYEEVLGRSFPGIKLLLLEDTLSCLKAVVYGRADATLGEAAVVQSMTARNMLTGLHISGEVEIGNPDLVNLRLGVRKDWPLFRSALQKAMASVLPAEIQQIREKWMIRGDGLSGRLSLTTEELAWVRNHPRIRANGGALAPFIISGQKGGRKGISVDILNLAAGLAGMSVDYVDGTWPQAMEMFRAGELDVLHCVSKTRDRDVFMSFTPPYLSLSAAVYVRKGNDTITGVPDLEGKTLAVTRLSHFYETIKADYPKINLMPVNSGAEGLKKVSTGAADAFVGNQVAAQYEIETGFIQNLRVAAYWETLRGDMRFGVAKDAVVLQGILQKALSALPADKKRRIISRYVSQAQRTQVSVIEKLPVDFKTLGITGGIVLVVVAAVFFLLIRMMRKESVAMSFGSPLFRGMVVVGLGVFIIVVAGLGWLLMERTRQAVIGNTESHLKLVLSLIQDRTQMWLEERTA